MVSPGPPSSRTTDVTDVDLDVTEARAVVETNDDTTAAAAAAAAAAEGIAAGQGEGATRVAANIALLIFATLAGTATWLTAGAVLPQLQVVFGISSSEASLLTLVVNAGFLLSSLASVATRLADRVRPSK